MESSNDLVYSNKSLMLDTRWYDTNRLDDSDSDEEEQMSSQKAYRVLYDSWVQLSKDKLQLVQDTLRLKAKVDLLEETGVSNVSDLYSLISANKDVKILQDGYIKEKERANLLQRKLDDNQKKIRMLNNGSQSLDTQRFWAEAVSTTCYITNRVYVKQGSTTTPYEIWKGKTPNLYYFRFFGCVCYILNDKDHLGV